MMQIGLCMRLMSYKTLKLSVVVDIMKTNYP